MLNEITLLAGIFLLTCVNLPMVLVYLGRREHDRRLQARLQARLEARR
jgi:hypothetical protein